MVPIEDKIPRAMTIFMIAAAVRITGRSNTDGRERRV
jgi:hypothetical protein